MVIFIIVGGILFFRHTQKRRYQFYYNYKLKISNFLITFFFLQNVARSRHTHYENLPMQYTEIFKVVKNDNFHQKNFDIFLIIFAQNIECGYT